MGTNLASKMVLNGYYSTNNRNMGILRIDSDSVIKMLKLSFPKKLREILPTMQCKFEMGTKLASKKVSNGYNSTNNRNMGVLRIDSDSVIKMRKITFLNTDGKILPTMQWKFKTGNGHQFGIKSGFKKL